MKSSLFRKYFGICSLCVFSCIMALGVILMVFASRFFEQDKFNLLDRSVTQASSITALTYTPTGPNSGQFDKNVITLIYSSLATASDADLLLADTSGKVVYAMENREELPEGYMPPDRIDQEIVNTALSGKYRESGLMAGHYDAPHYIVGVPVTVSDVSVGVLFATSPTGRLHTFIRSLLEMFLLSALVVLAIAFVIIYFITTGMVKPLKEMLAATTSFSKGDFSVRVPVSGYDELGQLSMAFNNMASTLATTESSRRSFVANVSHELKTPMTTIGGFIDGILDGTVPEEKRDQYLQVVSTETKRLSRLVRSMLDTSRIEAGEMSIRPTVFDVSELNRQTIFTFEQMIEEKKLSIEGLEIEKVMIYADRDLMNQVVYNLIENAVKFVEAGGVISFHYRVDKGTTYVAIRNTGEGLDKEEVPQLFERFYKSDKSRSLNKNGVGLGLHIVRSIVQYHGGEVFVRSAEGEYTEFEFTVPAGPKNS